MFRQNETAPLTPEQGKSRLVFQALQARRKGRLGHVQGPGRGTNPTRPDDLDEALESLGVHAD